MKHVYLGVDPGKTGGLAVLTPAGRVFLYPMPYDEHGVWDLIEELKEEWGDRLVCVIEKVQGFIGRRQPGSAMFTFGMGYGGLRMALIGHGVAFSESAPISWQRKMGIPPRARKEKKGHYKKRLLSTCKRLFPRYRNVVTLKTCDALLLAEFCRRQHSGQFSQHSTLVMKYDRSQRRHQDQPKDSDKSGRQAVRREVRQ